MEISPDMVRNLREQTGAGVMDCKVALVETDGNVERAVTILRKRGKIKAAKKAERVTAEGVIGAYVHTNKKVAAMVAVRCETDFVARSAPFQELAKDLAMHVAACDPLAVRVDDLPGEFVAEERAHATREVSALDKSAEMRERILEGKLRAVFAERTLLSQAFVKNPEITVADLIAEKVAELGENIVVRSFIRFLL